MPVFDSQILDFAHRPQLPTDKSITKDGSIRSGSTNSSSQDFDRNNGLNRMMSSLSIGEFANSSNLNRIDYAGIRVSHEHTDSGLGDQDYAYSSERWVPKIESIRQFIDIHSELIIFPLAFSNRSSDSAKYTNKSSGTSSILSANIHHTKFYAGNRHHRDIMTTSVVPTTASVISTAPVHKKFVNKTSCDNSNNNHFFISRFINNNNNSTPLGYNSHYTKSLSLNRQSEVSSTFTGVGCIPSAGTLTSPYAFAGSGCNKAGGRSTKSDIGVPIDRQLMNRNLAKIQCHNKHNINNNNNNLVFHKSKSILLPSVHSDLSLYDAPNHPKLPEIILHKRDILNNNYSLDNTPMCSPSALMSPSSKTGSASKLAYTNKHRFNNFDNPLTASCFNNGNDTINVSHQGPLVYKNDIDDDLTRCDWNNSVFDNPIMTVSQKLPTPPATNHFHIQCETLL